MSVSTYSKTNMNTHCIFFERIRRVPRQSGGSYARKTTGMKTGYLYHEIEIRLLLIAKLLINQNIKDKVTMNSSNYTLVTYLSDTD